MEDIKRILVVSRITKCCRKAIHYGISLSKKYGAELSVLHMIDAFWLRGWNVPMISVEEEYKRELKRTKEELDDMINMEKKKGMVIKESVKEGDPTEEILNVIKEENIDLVILLAHEEGRFEHFLFGRGNEALIRKMPCTVLLVKDEPEPLKEGR
ncbi:MAG: universal stress protein [Syntrophales bacterium]|jgi:nucleotide-binding universal stress UspA family protein